MAILVKIKNYRPRWKEHLERQDRNRISKAGIKNKPKGGKGTEKSQEKDGLRSQQAYSFQP